MYKIANIFFILLVVTGLTGCGNSHDPVQKQVQKEKSDIEKAKALFRSLRTQVNGLINLDDNGSGGFLNSEADRLGRSLEDVMLDVGLVGQYSGAILNTILDINDDTVPESTPVEAESPEEGRVIMLQKRTALEWDYNITQDGASVGNGTVKLPDENLSDLTYSNPDELNASLLGTFPLNRVDSGEAPGTQNGTLELSLQKLNGTASLLTIRKLAVTSNTAQIELSDFIIKTILNDATHIDYLILDSTKIKAVVPGYLFEGRLSLPENDYVTNPNFSQNGGNIPSRLIFNGSLKDTNTSARITGDLQLDWLDAATIDMSEGAPAAMHLKTTLSGVLERPSYQDTSVTLGYADKTDGTGKKVTASYQYDTTNVTLTGNFDNEMQNGTIEIDSTDDIKVILTVANGELVYGSQSYVKRGDTVIGTIEERNGVPVVMYKDGSFESLQ
ncbi:MAG: hypothetical protein DSZ05_02055 [Sulfurospirillum sp.]|nr:MAG: hypothetical protein DSZ05_02055 [Sulfurospirillum sp.]